MNKKLLMIPLLSACMLFNSPSILADTAIQEIAEIILHLNHRPSSSEKDSLRQIINNGSASENERAIASALLNMNHHVRADDRAKLEQIANDSSAPMADRKVAGILANLNHHPSARDREELENIE